MADAKGQINFSAPAELRKWPSVNGERNDDAAYPGSYLIAEGTFDECMRQFMSKPQRHLYEIKTAPQRDLVTATVTAEEIVQLARLREFL